MLSALQEQEYLSTLFQMSFSGEARLQRRTIGDHRRRQRKIGLALKSG